MPRYIDTEKIKYYRQDKLGLGIDYTIDEDSYYDFAYKNEIDNIPTADIEEVKHGEWIKPYSLLRPYCSVCKAICKDDEYTKFCHECGAKMICIQE